MAASALSLALPIRAQTTPEVVLDPVVVTSQRQLQNSFDAPAAISVVTRSTIDNGGAQVNLSEALNRVPGITVLNRQNYAQDLQLSIRGFGSRSTFGIRGVRLIVDGIPASMPDGQGQASNISLASVGRIEVLRGPMAQLYGNAAGGVVQVFTEDDALRPTATVSLAAGPYGQNKLGVKYSTTTPGYGLTLDASQYQTDGYRDHSEAKRGQFNARWQSDLTPSTHVSVIVNALDQPNTQDPIGLTRTQWETTDPKRVAATAITQDAGKTVRQQQVGTVIEHRVSDATVVTARVYLGQRSLDNALSTPLSAQLAPTSSGGIVQFDRGYGGLGAQLAHRLLLPDGRALRFVGGIEYDRMNEDRQGYINNAGQQGDLKRDEKNRVENRDVYLQGSLDLTKDWEATAGLRSSEVRFTTQDHFITSANPDDSGFLNYSATSPVLGLSWHATPDLHVYANLGRGFETPTFTELAYRRAGTGLNTDLKASRSKHGEIGTKWKLAHGHRVDLALFGISTSDEIVVDTNQGGRSTFKNAGRTHRRGIEFAHVGQWTPAWRSTLSVTALHARFIDAFQGSDGKPVAAGNRLPGTPERSLFAELAWTPQAAWGGFNSGIEWIRTGSLTVDDKNSDAAAAANVINLRAGFAQSMAAWRFTQLLRVENATDRTYAGSVIVNDANSRFFEPALPRNWLLSVTARREF